MYDSLKIYNVDYPIKFGYGMIRRFCEAIDPPLEGVGAYYKFLREINWGELSFKTLDNMALLTVCAIESGIKLKGSDETAPNCEHVFEWFGEDVENMAKLMELLTKSLPSKNGTEVPEGEKKKVKPREKVKK